MLRIDSILQKLNLSMDDISFMSEYGGFYYIKPKSEDWYDSLMWRVDKNTGEKEYFDQIEYITTEINGKPLGDIANIIKMPL